MNVDNKNFIFLLKRKNEKALDYVIDTYGGLIKKIVVRELYNLKSVQGECINDILLGVWNNIEMFDENRSTFKNWLIGICRYKTIDFKRKYLKELDKANIDDVIITMPDNASNEITKNELDSSIDKLLSCLKKEDRSLFIKIYVEENQIEEVSNETGLKKSVIYNRLSRGKRKLRNIVENRG